MMAGRVGEDVAAAGMPGLESATAWGLETIPTFFLRGNMAKALRLAGEVHRAAELIDPVRLGDQPTYEDLGVQGERASLDMVRGRCGQAVTRLDALTALPSRASRTGSSSPRTAPPSTCGAAARRPPSTACWQCSGTLCPPPLRRRWAPTSR